MKDKDNKDLGFAGLAHRSLEWLGFWDPTTPFGIYITSPSGKTTRRLWFWEARRIVIKHNWHFTSMIPRPSRLQALKIFITGKTE